jgi:hypothetical protein
MQSVWDRMSLQTTYSNFGAVMLYDTMSDLDLFQISKGAMSIWGGVPGRACMF